MTAVGLLVRADLRRRWRSWVVLGVLAGASIGLACAGIAGARRTDRAVPAYARAVGVPDAAVLPNDPAFDEAMRARLAALPEVDALYPFVVPFMVQFAEPAGIEPGLIPTTPASVQALTTPLVVGRFPAEDRADEIVVNEIARDRFDLDVGSTMTIVQPAVDDPSAFPIPIPPRSNEPIEQELRVVGVMDATSPDDIEMTPSSGFYEKYRDQLIGVTNAFVDLRRDSDDLARFRADVDEAMGRPVNVINGPDLFQLRQTLSVSDVEAGGLLLFALTVLVGAGVLVGQALVRAVYAGAADFDTWRAIGIDRRVARRAMIAPAGIAAAVGGLTTVLVAIALSGRFPIGFTRQFELDIGLHADWTVLALGAMGVVVVVMSTAWIAAALRIRRARRLHDRAATRAVRVSSLPPPLLIGSRLATDAGRGSRAVPVRSALVGAIAGVLGVVGCLTFRSGLSETVGDPTRAGVVWDHAIASSGRMPARDIDTIANDPAVDAMLRATWARAIPIDDTSTPTFGVSSEKGQIELEVLAGEAPDAPDEIALAPLTMRELGLGIGDRVTVGEDPGRTAEIVGRALLPGSSHTEYDQGAWMTAAGLRASLPKDVGGEFFEDYMLLRWKPRSDVRAAEDRLGTLGDGAYFSEPSGLPQSVASLRALRVLPPILAVFFALLAIATVSHALVTTVRRRRADLAVLRSIGFTRTDARLAIAWQATVLAIIGLVVGVPAGIVLGRLVWKQLAESFPVVYVPPLALIAVLVVAPAAIAIANALAAGPAHAATRIRPAAALRSE
jgi:hypothetical protein